MADQLIPRCRTVRDENTDAAATFRAEYARLMERRRALILAGVSESELAMPEAPDSANPPIFVANGGSEGGEG